MYARDFKLIIPVFEDLRISLTSCKTENDNWLSIVLKILKAPK